MRAKTVLLVAALAVVLVIIGLSVERSNDSSAGKAPGMMRDVGQDEDGFYVQESRPSGTVAGPERVPPCAAADLEGAYGGGQPGTGMLLATIVVSRTGDEPCSVRGQYTLDGLDVDGRRVTGPSTGRVRGVLDLSGARTGGTALVRMTGDLRGDSQPGGECPRKVTPARWRLNLDGAVVTFANRDADGKAFASCAGDLQLDDLTGTR